MKRNLFLLSILTIILMFIAIYLSKVDSKALFPFKLSHYEDTTSFINLNQVIHLQQTGAFKSINSSRVNLGYTESIHWFYFRIDNDLAPADLSLELSNLKINKLELFELKNGKVRSLGKTGDKLPFKQRPTLTTTFVYPIRLDSYEKAEYYFVVDKKFEELATPVRLWKTSNFEEHDQKRYMFWGLFVGIVGLVALLNFVFWIVSSDKIYFWYNAFIITLLFRQLTDTGYSFQFFWPNTPQINSPDSLIMSAWLYIFTFFNFAEIFTNQDKERYRSFTFIKYFKWAPLISFFIVVCLQLLAIPEYNPHLYIFVFRVQASIAFTAVVIMFWSVFDIRRSSNPLVIYYAFAVSVQLIGQTITTIQQFTRNKTDGVMLVETHVMLNVAFLIDLIVFTMGLAYRYSQSRKQNVALALQLYQTNQEETQKVIEALQIERKQITQNLYEDVGTTLSAAQFELDNFNRKNKKLLMLTDAKKLIDKAINDLRMVTNNLIPLDFAEKGLAKSLEEMIRKLNTTSNVTFEYIAKTKPKELSTANEVQIYRMATELVKNILKHAQATQAIVELNYCPNYLELKVEDNGKGFDENQISDGIGVRNIYSRADYLRAEVNVQSDQAGTKVVVKVPY